MPSQAYVEYTPLCYAQQLAAILGMALRQILAENLRQSRLRLGLSQEGLADAAGIDRTYVSALERGRYAASVDVIERLAQALNVEPALLLARPRSHSTEQ